MANSYEDPSQALDMEGRTSVFRDLPLKIKLEPPDDISSSEDVLLPTATVATNVSKAKLEELTSLRNMVEKSHDSYLQCHLLLPAIKEVACESKSEFPLITQKVQQIIASGKVANIANLNSGKINESDESLKILGLEDSHQCGPSTVLSYSEKIILKSAVETKLLRNCTRIQKCMHNGGKEFLQKEGIPKDIISSDKFELVRLAELRLKECNEDSVTVSALVKELSDMQLGFSETVKTEVIPWFEAKCESLELEAKILELELLVDMFSENPKMPEAMKKIDEYSQALYEEMKSELEKLKNDEKAYDELASTEYDRILKKYKHYKQELDNKMWMLNELS